MESPEKTTVVLADDHDLLRDGFRFNLSHVPGIEIVAEARNGMELIEAVTRLEPHIVITDIKMPLLDGLQVTRLIKERFPEIKVIVLSNYDEEDLITDMMEAGVDAYLLKNAHKNELFEAINSVMCGKPFYCTTISSKVLCITAKKAGIIKDEKAFTKREIDVMKLVAQGLSTKQIADVLGVKTRTIESHKASLIFKLGVSSSVGIAIHAAKHGYL